MAIKTRKTYTSRVNTGGNFCGHNPTNPACYQYVRRLAEQARHPLLKTAIRNLARYYRQPGMLQFLNPILSNGDDRRRRRDGEYRHIRSERRDAIVCVLAAVLADLDLMTLRVGKTTYGDSQGLLAPYFVEMAEATGLSLSRFENAMTHIRNGGYLSVTPRHERQEDGSYKSLSAVVCVREFLFPLLGISPIWLARAREHRAKQWKEKRLKFYAKRDQQITDKMTAKARAEAAFRASNSEVSDLLDSLFSSWQSKRTSEPITAS